MIRPQQTGEVTREQIRVYADAVGDHNPVHLDDEFAKRAGLPSVIAHGPLSLALVIDALAGQLGPEALRAFDARLKAPVFPGDRLHIEPTEQGVEVRNGSGAVVASVTLDVVAS